METLRIKPTLLMAIIFSLLVIASLSYQGCASTRGTAGPISVSVNQDPRAVKVVIGEAAYNFAYYMLRGQSADTVSRVEIGLKTIEDVLAGGDVTMALDSVMALVETYGYIDPVYFPLAKTAVRLLGILVNVDIAIPESAAQAKEGILSFLDGARRGIADVRG